MNPGPDQAANVDATESLGDISSGPLGLLPQLSHRQVQLENRLSRLRLDDRFPTAALGMEEFITPLDTSRRPDVAWRPSGLNRPGLVVQCLWPRLSTRLALGVETQVAHALVDRMLGSSRSLAEARLQLTPVEWGILTYLFARGLSGLAGATGALGPWDLVIDRVGPDPFDVRRLGSIVTLRWGVRVGDVDGAVRLWLPETLVARWLATEPPPPADADSKLLERSLLAELAGIWRAEAGVVELPRGLGTIRVGGVLPLGGSRLHGTPRSPSGPVELTLRLSGSPGRLWFATEPVAGSGGLHLILQSPVQKDSIFREGLALNPTTESSTGTDGGAGATAPTDIPVTLTVELGRVNLTLSRLAGLKTGDVIELGRHSREPVELTSNGRLVARGELVQIDTELGVRVTNVFI